MQQNLAPTAETREIRVLMGDKQKHANICHMQLACGAHGHAHKPVQAQGRKLKCMSNRAGGIAFV